MEINGWLSALIVGLVLGIIGRLIIRPSAPIGWIWTIIAGIAGGLIGNWLADLAGWSGFSQFGLQAAAAAVVVGLVGAATKG